MSTLQVGEVGAILRLRIVDSEERRPVDVSEATTMTIVISNRLGSRVELSAEFTTDGSDGKIQAVTEEDTLDVDGVWYAQGVIVTDSDEVLKTSIAKFEVQEAL